MNMRYCQYENTYKELVDCMESMDEESNSESEAKYKQKLINLCKRIAEEYGETEQ